MQKNLVCCWEAKIRSRTCHWQGILGSASGRVRQSLDAHVVSRFLPKQWAWGASFLTCLWLDRAGHYFGRWNDGGFTDCLCWVINNESDFNGTEHLGSWLKNKCCYYIFLELLNYEYLSRNSVPSLHRRLLCLKQVISFWKHRLYLHLELPIQYSSPLRLHPWALCGCFWESCCSSNLGDLLEGSRGRFHFPLTTWKRLDEIYWNHLLCYCSSSFHISIVLPFSPSSFLISVCQGCP